MERKRRLWPWLLLLALLVWIGGTVFFYLNREATFAVSETGVDKISEDPKTGVIVSRDRRTGKIVVLDVNDVMRDEVRPAFSALPSWVPIYPRVREAESAAEGALRLHTPDPPAQVLSFYELALGRQGLSLTREAAPDRVVLSGVRRRERVSIQVEKKGAGTVLELLVSAR